MVRVLHRVREAGSGCAVSLSRRETKWQRWTAALDGGAALVSALPSEVSHGTHFLGQECSASKPPKLAVDFCSENKAR